MALLTLDADIPLEFDATLVGFERSTASTYLWATPRRDPSIDPRVRLVARESPFGPANCMIRRNGPEVGMEKGTFAAPITMWTASESGELEAMGKASLAATLDEFIDCFERAPLWWGRSLDLPKAPWWKRWFGLGDSSTLQPPRPGMVMNHVDNEWMVPDPYDRSNGFDGLVLLLTMWDELIIGPAVFYGEVLEEITVTKGRRAYRIRTSEPFEGRDEFIIMNRHEPRQWPRVTSESVYVVAPGEYERGVPLDFVGERASILYWMTVLGVDRDGVITADSWKLS